MKILDDYKICVTLILLLIVASILAVPFAAKNIMFSALAIPVTPILVMAPIIQGIIYAIVVSYEHPKMTEEDKMPFRVVKLVNFLAFYIITAATMIHAFL